MPTASTPCCSALGKSRRGWPPRRRSRTTRQLVGSAHTILGPDHPDILTARGNLAYWRVVAGDPGGAAAAFEQLLADYMRVPGPDHPHTVIGRHELAYWQSQAAGSATENVSQKQSSVCDRARRCDVVATRRGPAGS